VRGVVAGVGGSLWCWFERAVARLHRGRWHVFAGPRWLPEGAVQAVWPGADGGVRVRTASGRVRLYLRHLTFAEKAAWYEAQVAARHERRGYVAACRLQRVGDLSSAVRYATDNDGLWTAMYLAAQCYCWAVTHNPEARRRARQAMQALLDLQRVTPIEGFPARALVYDGEQVLRSDPDRCEWHAFVLPDSRSGQWKGDTSSDEIVGHVYGLSLYYDLAAAEERGAVSAALASIADHVLEHGYYLVDVDGAPTTWGIWAPQDLNADPYRMGDRGLNALELLALLRAAHHVTGSQRYLGAYHDLIARHGYALNVVDQRHTVPGHVNHSDDELAFLAYYPLLKYEDDASIRALYERGLERAWQHVRPEACPLWNWIYGASTGRPCDADAAREALADIPLDLVTYHVDATDRLDVVVRPYRDRHGRPQAERPLPWLERPPMQWNGNPYSLLGGDGRAEEAGTVYLLPYWMGRYYGFVE
jgi:hypothetical protein